MPFSLFSQNSCSFIQTCFNFRLLEAQLDVVRQDGLNASVQPDSTFSYYCPKWRLVLLA